MPLIQPPGSNKKIIPVELEFTVKKNAPQVKQALEQQKEILTAEQKLRNQIIKDETQAIALEIRKLNLMQAQAEQLRVQAQLLQKNAKVLRNQASDIELVAKPLAVIGGLLTGTIIGAATRYIARTKEINEVTDRWYRAQTRISEAQDRIGKVAAQTLLPYYEKIAAFAEKIASFIEQNPEVVEAGLKLGAAATLTGTIGLAVAKGIRIVADNKMSEAANKMLLAAQMMNGAADKQIAAGGGKISGAGSSLGKAGLIAGGFALGTAITIETAKGLDYISDKLIEIGGTSKAAGEGMKSVINGLSVLSPAISSVVNRVLGRSTSSGSATPGANTVSGGSLAGSPYEKEVVTAYTRMMDDELRITQETAAAKKKILEETVDRERSANASNTKHILEINSNARKQIASITSSHQSKEKEYFQDYLVQRSEIARDGGEEIVRIEQSLQERLRKMNMEHEDRLAELAADRDALGYVKEQRAFDRNRKEAERETGIEIAQRRRDLAIRLNDLSRSYQRERDQRLAAYQEQIKQVREERIEQLAQQRAHHNDEMKEIQEAKSKQLKELELQKRDELARNRQAFVSHVRDLNAALLGEDRLYQAHYQKMLQEADAFLNTYRAKYAASTSPKSTISGASSSVSVTRIGKATGGYAAGPINTGEEGIEYLLNARSTRIAEKLIGGLTQEKLLAAIAAGSRGGNNITLYDQRRMDFGPSQWQRQEMDKATLQTIKGVFS